MSTAQVDELILGEAQISVDELKKITYTGDEEIRKELLEVLKMCGIPEEYAPLFKYVMQEHIRSIIKRKGLPEEDWLINALYNIYIHITYITTTHFKQCTFKTDPTTLP
jgi:hypothetical protein